MKHDIQALRNLATRTVDEIFLSHPHAGGETYLQHMRFILSIAGYLLLTTFIALIHGLFPKYMDNVTSDRIIRLADDFKKRRMQWSTDHAPPAQ